MKGWENFHRHITFRVGDGCRINFWNHKWCCWSRENICWGLPFTTYTWGLNLRELSFQQSQRVQEGGRMYFGTSGLEGVFKIGRWQSSKTWWEYSTADYISLNTWFVEVGDDWWFVHSQIILPEIFDETWVRGRVFRTYHYVSLECPERCGLFSLVGSETSDTDSGEPKEEKCHLCQLVLYVQMFEWNNWSPIVAW